MVAYEQNKINVVFVTHDYFCFIDNYPVHSGESFCSSDLSLDGTEAGFEIAENETGGPESSHQGSSHSHHTGSSQESPSLSQSLHAAINDPINKLYRMSNSYFTSDHV